MRYRIPAYIPFMALITAAYLTVEIPFSVRLVEVLGGDPSQADIDSLEGFGRVLTGVAVAIWIVGSFVLPRLHARGHGFIFSLVTALAIGVASVWGTYVVLDTVARQTGLNSSGSERKEAFIAGMARRHIAETGLHDIEVSPLNDWNTFVAVMPEIAGADALVTAAGLTYAQLAESEAERRVGSLEAMREEVFGPGFGSVRSAYEEYRKGSRRYLDARASLGEAANRAYDELVAEVIRKHGKLPGQGWTNAAIVRQVRARGVPVDQWWVVGDRRGFTGPYMKAMAERIEAEYVRAVELALGSGERLKPGLGLDGFASHPAIQRRVRKALGLPASGAAIVPGMDDESFRIHVYQPKLEEARNAFVRAATAHPSSFEGGGEFASLGTEAVKAARLPAMAILLSIAGAALHIFKFSGYAVQIVSAVFGLRVRSGMRHVWGAAFTAAAFAVMAAPGNAVTESASFAEVRKDGIWQSLLGGAITIQPAFSDAGRFLGRIGGWQAFAANMPQPSRPVSRKPSAAGKGSFQTLPDGPHAPRPTPAPRIPVPTPAPRG